ncbi:MAG: type II secretion system minor pseudopilin GspJ [Stenotrophomonas sp.]
MPAPRARGFTLVEVMIALLVFAMLAAAGVGILAWTAGQHDVVRARLDRLGQLQRAHGLLKADLAQVAPRRVRRADGGAERAVFVASPPGDTRQPLFAFVRRGHENPDAEPRASLQYVEYRVLEDRLERSARPMLDGTAADTPRVLLDGVESVRAHYYERGAWSDGWGGGTETLPRAVMLELRLRDFGQVRNVFLVPGENR